MSAAALDALEMARYALKDPSKSEAEVNHALGQLAHELGTTRPERGTLVAMRAVIDKLERPEVFPRDQDAWEMHGAKPRSFKTWKQRINGLVLSMAVDMLQEDDFLEFTAYHTMAPTVDCWAGVSGLTREEESENRQVEVANKDARALLTAHAAAYIARSKEKATYESWVRLLHPEDMQLDARLLQEGCEHRRIWEAALKTPAPAEAGAFTRSHHSVIELTIGSFFVVAVSAVEMVLLSVRLPLEGASRVMKQSSTESLERVQRGDAVAMLTLPIAVLAAALEVAFTASALIMRVAEEVTVGALISMGTLLHGIFALSPSAGSKAAHRLYAVSRAVRRRMQGKRAEAMPPTQAQPEPSISITRRTGLASSALLEENSQELGKSPCKSARASSSPGASSSAIQPDNRVMPTTPKPDVHSEHNVPVVAGILVHNATSVAPVQLPSAPSAPAMEVEKMTASMDGGQETQSNADVSFV